MSKHTSTIAAAVVGGAMLALTMTPASAFTLSGSAVEQSQASASQVDKTWWRGGCGWRGCGWGYRGGWGWRGGWGPGWGYGYRHCWRGYYGRLHCGW